MSILVVMAHPDDEVLGCGGILSRSSDRKNIMFMATGELSREKNNRKQSVEDLQKDSLEALKVFGITLPSPEVNEVNILYGTLPDNKMDTVPMLEVCQLVECIIKEIKPDSIFTHHQYDANIDHRITFEAVMIATRNKHINVLSCEIPSSTGYIRPARFEPNHYIELSEDNLNDKLTALSKYKNEIRPYPHPRSPEAIKALAMVRGSESGYEYAEAFMVVKSYNCL